jgi:hypothetical protein
VARPEREPGALQPRERAATSASACGAWACARCWRCRWWPAAR